MCSLVIRTIFPPLSVDFVGEVSIITLPTVPEFVDPVDIVISPDRSMALEECTCTLPEASPPVPEMSATLPPMDDDATVEPG
jgi:hypothetical protein